MSAAFHHGTETKRIDGGTSPIYTADGAITAIVGTAPAGAVNTLTVCAAARDFLQFVAKYRYYQSEKLSSGRFAICNSRGEPLWLQIFQ